MSSGSRFGVGNDFIMPVNKPAMQLHSLAADSVAAPILSIPVQDDNEITRVAVKHAIAKTKAHNKVLELFYSHTVVTFAFIILAIALVAQPLVINLWPTVSLSSALVKPKATYGLNVSVNKADLQNWITQFTSQEASINLGSKTVPITPATIRSWINVSTDGSTDTAGIHLNTALVQSSLESQANTYITKPVDQVTVTRSDGSSETVITGKNGSDFANQSSIASQAQDISKNLFSNKGFQLNAPLVSSPFKTINPSAFKKLIVVDVNSKEMYLYQDGQLINSFLVSAGKPATPTPIGEFHIYSKLKVQNMSGYNPNGSKYFQPNVQWVNYFTGGDAIHGVYWHPLSYFGNINSSHGCVGVPDNTAQYIYGWAPIGTTVITTPN